MFRQGKSQRQFIRIEAFSKKRRVDKYVLMYIIVLSGANLFGSPCPLNPVNLGKVGSALYRVGSRWRRKQTGKR